MHMERVDNDTVESNLIDQYKFKDVVDFQEIRADLIVEIIALCSGVTFRCIVDVDLPIVHAHEQRSLRLRGIKGERIECIAFLLAERLGCVVEDDAFVGLRGRIRVIGSELICDVLIC